MTPLRREIDVLVACARFRLAPDEVARVRSLLAQGVDWEYLITAAQNHGLSPLLASQIKRHFTDAFPLEVTARLLALSQQTAARSLLLTAELVRILDLFAQHQIPALAYKGPALASLLYSNVALRDFCDLDILVPERDVLRAKEQLMAEGYRPELPLTARQESAYLTEAASYDFLSPDRLCRVEIHWQAVARYCSVALQPARLWDRRSEVSVGGRHVSAPSAEDLLQWLSVHGAKHCWSRIGWISDLAELIASRPALDWDGILREARDARIERMLLLGVHLAHRLFQAPLPTPVTRLLDSHPEIARLEERVYAQWTDPSASEPGLLARSRFFLRARESWSDRVRYLFRFAFTPTPGDWMSVSLPDALFPLYRVVRWFRLAGKYALGIGSGASPVAASGLPAAETVSAPSQSFASRLGKFWRLPLSDQKLLARAAWQLSAVSLGLRLLPFSFWQRRMESSPSADPAPAAADSPERMLWSVSVASHYVPGATCLARALVAQGMLRRAGQASQVRLGVSLRPKDRLQAHAWLERDGRILLGAEDGPPPYVPLPPAPVRARSAPERKTGTHA